MDRTEAAPSADPATAPLHVVFDTDLAFDDIMALLYLLQRDDVAIDAVTIAGTGEAHCDPGVPNALGCSLSGAPPTRPSRADARRRSKAPTPSRRSGGRPWTISPCSTCRRSTARTPRRHRLLLDTLDGDATLITLGPLTNIAEALRADPGLASRVPAFVAMAGAIDAGGNTPNGVAEYNVWVDPLAAKEVVEGMDVTLVPLDATDDVPFTPFFADVLGATARPRKPRPPTGSSRRTRTSSSPPATPSGTRSPPRSCSAPSSPRGRTHPC